jgi:hypothetical protein
VIFALVLVALALANATLSGIYTAAIYRYAVDGETSDFFAPELVKDAFRLK